MNILHTESSNGWGGQEIRILKESKALRERGHSIFFAITRGGKLVEAARKEGFKVYEIDFRRSRFFKALFQICRVVLECRIDIVNTHSSFDAWLGGIAARLTRRFVIRTRHLSTPIRGGLNARLLYNKLADFVVTTSSGIIPYLQKEALLPTSRIQCIPTGVEPFEVPHEAVHAFRSSLGVKEGQILIGTVCVVRSWKGIQDLIAAAKLLRFDPRLKWVVVGGGYLDRFKPLVDADLPFVFTGHLESPFVAMSALDIFALLSTAHEGISQALLQAAFLKKALIATTVGGSPEVCQDGVTGLLVPPSSPEIVARAVCQLADDPALRQRTGLAAHQLILNRYTLHHTLEAMVSVLSKFSSK